MNIFLGYDSAIIIADELNQQYGEIADELDLDIDIIPEKSWGHSLMFREKGSGVRATSGDTGVNVYVGEYAGGLLNHTEDEVRRRVYEEAGREIASSPQIDASRQDFEEAVDQFDVDKGEDSGFSPLEFLSP